MSWYSDEVERRLKGCRFASTGPIYDGGCEACKEAGYTEDVGDEGSFSHSQCGVCGQRLAGTRYVWHWVDDNNEIIHEDDCCGDCVVYLAYGDEPLPWYATWDRFDICEAYNLLAHDWGLYDVKARLDRMGFECSPMRETYEGLSENAQAIYNLADQAIRDKRSKVRSAYL